MYIINFLGRISFKNFSKVRAPRLRAFNLPRFKDSANERPFLSFSRFIPAFDYERRIRACELREVSFDLVK